MILEEVLKQNYMGFILRLRDNEQLYDHFEWFAKGRFEEVFNTLKYLAVYDAVKLYDENFENDMVCLDARKPILQREVEIFSTYTHENASVILQSTEDEFAIGREYVRRAFGIRLRELDMNMKRSYNDLLQKRAKEEESNKRWQARMAVKTIEESKRDVYYGGTERSIQNAYYEYYYNFNSND